jgi:hypothetical protein
MHNYDAEIREAKAYLESLTAAAKAEFEAELAAAEELAAIEADDADEIEADDGTNAFGFVPYIAADGRRIAFEAFPLEELDDADRIDALREANGWKFWRQDSDGQRWYVQSGVEPTEIRGVPPSIIGGDYD